MFQTALHVFSTLILVAHVFLPLKAVAGTALVAGGAAVLNQLYERDTDALMRRTRTRPLPAGRLTPADARMFGYGLTAAGLAGYVPVRQNTPPCRPNAGARRIES